MMISILIATNNRPQRLAQCIESILLSSYSRYEIIVIDQSDTPQTVSKNPLFASKRIVYLHVKQKGKARALNTGMRAARGDIFAFLDDDCLVDRMWLQKIHNSYMTHPQIAGVFGNTYPYQPRLHPNQICPATFTAKKTAVYKNPGILHYIYLGQGNNMSIRRSTIQQIGQFREWLGPGSVGIFGGEDSDMIFRILSQNLSLMINPKMVVYHNKWLTRAQEKILQSGYTYGLMAFFGYFLLTKYKNNIWKLIQQRSAMRLTSGLKQLYESAKTFCVKIFILLLELFAITAGLCVGIAMFVWKHAFYREK